MKRHRHTDDRDDARRGGVRILLIAAAGLIAGGLLGAAAFVGGQLSLPDHINLPGLPSFQGEQARAQRAVPTQDTRGNDETAPPDTEKNKNPDGAGQQTEPAPRQDRVGRMLQKLYPVTTSRDTLRSVQEGREKVEELRRLRRDWAENQPDLVEQQKEQ